MKTGQRLGRETAFTVQSKRGGTQAKALSAARRRFKNLRRFTVHEPAAARQSSGKALSSMPHATHVFVAMKPRRKSMQTRNVPIFDAFLAFQVKGEMVEINLVSK